jgi:phosphatidate cytidylyltransferase
MRTRVPIAIVLIALVLLGFVVPALKFVSVAFAVGLGLLCIDELARIFRPKKINLGRPTAITTSLLLAWAAWNGRMDLGVYLVGFTAVMALAWRLGKHPMEGAWRDVAATIAAVVYVAVPIAVLIDLFVRGRQAQDWLLLLFAIVWATDIAAYLAGRAFGSRRMLPRLSPSKTMEGGVGGVMGAVLVTALARELFPAMCPTAPIYELLLLAFLISVAAQMGDLGESLLKRDAGVKDSGSVLLGHGGALDRLDSLLFVSVPWCLYLRMAHPAIFDS